MSEDAHPGLYEFLARHDPDSTRVIADWWPERDADGNSPLVIVRHGKFTAVLALMPFDGDDAHLCIDVHPFADGEDATAGVLGMTTGKQWQLPATGTTSHGLPSVHLVSVLIGEQGETSLPDSNREHGWGGDTVRVTGGKWAGFTGRIEHVHKTGSYKVRLDTDLPGWPGKLITVQRDDAELTTREQEKRS